MPGSTRGTIYLAGGCFWGVEELFRQIRGVVRTCAGYANGTGEDDASYRRVCEGDTGFRETVRVDFDEGKVSLEQILWAYFSIIDATVSNQQGNDVGTQYQTGIYWERDKPELGERVRIVADDERARLQAAGRPFCVEICELTNFFSAEEYHQRYLVKNQGGYCHISREEMDAVLRELA